MINYKEDEWYKTRPQVIKKAIEIWFLGDKILIEDKEYYVIGYAETNDSKKSEDIWDLMLIVSHIDPAIDWENSHKEENIIRVCTKHLRKTNA